LEPVTVDDQKLTTDVDPLNEVKVDVSEAADDSFAFAKLELTEREIEPQRSFIQGKSSSCSHLDLTRHVDR